MKKQIIFFLGLTMLTAMVAVVYASEKGSYSDSLSGSMNNDTKGSVNSLHHMATAQIKGTQPGSDISGSAEFTETQNGLRVHAHIQGVSGSGKHGFHIHENGSCDNSGKAAGGHYNPKEVKHGYLPDDGLKGAHAGDMGNIVIDQKGEGKLTVDLPGLSLLGKNNVLGRAVILHEKEDDFGQPTGNAGSRIGCGVIEAVAMSMTTESQEPKGSMQNKGSY
ncbi:MAG: superoxide dismutase family protein [Candidatus Omnitrophica bacterium]|nr:superoxide dismutase family protein [Candidatus Omnitrophota bacterium]